MPNTRHRRRSMQRKISEMAYPLRTPQRIGPWVVIGVLAGISPFARGQSARIDDLLRTHTDVATTSPRAASTATTAGTMETAACCYTACSDSSNATCTTGGDCPFGEACVTQDGGASPSVCQRTCRQDADCAVGTCEPTCGLMEELDCYDIGGTFLAPPFLEAPVEACAANTCETGSCCPGPGQCEDQILGTLITLDDCLGRFAGNYAGGVGCRGGTCSGGDRDGLGCSHDTMCPGGTCEGVPFDPPIYLPCPVCEVATGGNCQYFDDSLASRPSDLTLPGGTRTADDFIPTADVISTVCVWGNYAEIDATGNTTDCADTVSDSFEVSVYYPDANGVPDTLNPAGASFVTGANVAKVLIPSSLEAQSQIRVYAYQLTLDTPIQLNPNDPPDQIYWLEVQNVTQEPSVNACVWNWQAVDTIYNDYSSAGDVIWFIDLRTDDFAFCLDTDFTAPDPYLRQCCDCSEVCTLETKRDCDVALSSFDVTQDTCGACGPMPPLEDNCLDAINSPPLWGQAVVVNFDNHCTTMDGPNPTPTELNPAGVTAANDLWYLFQTPIDGGVLFSTCATGYADGGGVDTLIAVYSVDCSAPTCPTQADHLSRLVSGTAHDEDCNGRPDGGGGWVQVMATAGECFLVRVAGVGGTGSELGRGTVAFEAWPIKTWCDPPDQVYCKSFNRFIGMEPWSEPGSLPTTIKVEVVDNPLDAARVGDVWWAGPAVPIDNAPHPSLRGSPLRCTATPFAQNWPAGDLYLYGGAVVPGATYRLSICGEFGGECVPLSLLFSSAVWGDVVAPFGEGAQPNFGDISAIVDKFKALASAPDTVFTDLRSAAGQAVDFATDFADISSGVDAFKGTPYPFTIPACP